MTGYLNTNSILKGSVRVRVVVTVMDSFGVMVRVRVGVMVRVRVGIM